MQHLILILDKVANELEARGMKKLAAEVDEVSNALESPFTKVIAYLVSEGFHPESTITSVYAGEGKPVDQNHIEYSRPDGARFAFGYNPENKRYSPSFLPTQELYTKVYTEDLFPEAKNSAPAWNGIRGWLYNEDEVVDWMRWKGNLIPLKHGHP